MTFFWILWGFDALIALVAVYFFLIGLSDGSVHTHNMGLWWMIFAALTCILLGGFGLMKYDFLGPATSLLSVLAVPGLLYLLMMISMLFIKNWR